MRKVFFALWFWLRYRTSAAFRAEYHEAMATALRQQRGPYSRNEGEYITCQRCRTIQWGWSNVCPRCGLISGKGVNYP